MKNSILRLPLEVIGSNRTADVVDRDGNQLCIDIDRKDAEYIAYCVNNYSQAVYYLKLLLRAVTGEGASSFYDADRGVVLTHEIEQFLNNHKNYKHE